MPRRDDSVRLQEMLDAARKAQRLARDRSRADLADEDDPLADALIRLISVVGEAAARISKETQDQIDSIPWPDVVGMRNRLIHEYFDVDLDILWATVQNSLPPLIESLEAALKDLEGPAPEAASDEGAG